MLENWCWEEDALKSMSGHVSDHSKPLPTELIRALIKSRNANAGGAITLMFDITTFPVADCRSCLAVPH